MPRRRHGGTRVLVLAGVVLTLLAGPAVAERPRVAVLGLEVVGAIDQKTTSIAQDLTQGLRARPRSGNGPYLLAANSDRELIDEKMIKSCDDEAPKCMTEIGKGLGTDFLIYGNVKKSGDNLNVTIQILDVKKRSRKEHAFMLPAAAAAAEVRAAAKKAYTELTGDVAPPAGGTLVVRVNVPTARVLVDGEARELTNGTVTLTLPAGEHKVAVSAEGHVGMETTVTVQDDETVTREANLAKEVTATAGGGGGGRSGVWKPAFIISTVGALALGGISTWAFLDSQSQAENITGSIAGCSPPADCRPTEAQCGEEGAVVNDNGSHAKACSAHKLHTYTLIGAAALGVAAAVTGYFAFLRSDTETPAQGDVAITPMFGPDGGGATLNVTW